MRMKFLACLTLWMGLACLAHGQGSVIRITFADPGLPNIDVSGKAAVQVQPYGVSESKAVARARAEAALKTPPPEYEAFAMVWQPIHTIQKTILNGGTAVDAAGYPIYSPDEPRTQRVETFNDWQAFPVYDVEEYLAEMAAWRREMIRARAVLDP